MANFKPDPMMIAGMTTADKAALLSIYQHRCLNRSLLIQYVYEPNGISGQTASHKISAMLLDGLLEPVCYGEGMEAFFLTTLGIKTTEIIYGEKLSQLYKPGKESAKLPGYASLKMNSTNINHQMHLNQFGLEFESYAKELVPYSYYDEKFMPPASDFMMPDGMIALPDRLLFLEMDMGTESAGRLMQKWNSYRMFLNDPKGFYQNRPITMFFLIEGVKNPRLRQQNTMRVLLRHLGNRVKGSFEAYFDAPGRCHQIIQTKYLDAGTEMGSEQERVLHTIQNIHGFTVSQPSFLKKVDVQDGYYIRKVSGKGKIELAEGRPQEFLLEVWTDQRFSILRKISDFGLFQKQIASLAKRKVSYVLVVPSIVWANSVLKITQEPLPDEVYFTTLERLEKMKWCEALFQIDQIKNLIHFETDSLRSVVYEKRLTKL